MSESAAIPDLPDDWQKAGLFYRAENGIDFFNLAIPPEDTITDPRERESCRAFLVRALALLDAGPAPGEEPSKSARDQFIDVLRSRGMIRPGEEWVIDANLARYAHELAERQRASGRDDYCTGIGCCGEHGGVADLIDPYASAGPARPDEEAVVAYRWDTNQGGRHTSNIWCPECNTEFHQSGTADADLTARDITPGQTCDVCGKNILTGRLPEGEESTP